MAKGPNLRLAVQETAALARWRAGSGLGLLVVLLETTGAKVFRNEKHGDVIVKISDEKVDVAATKPEAAF